MSRKTQWAVSVAGLVLAASFVTVSATTDLHRRIPLFLVLYGTAFVAYLVATVALLRRPTDSRALLVLLVVVAVAVRLVLIPAKPELSTDVYRYLWEGRLVAEGINPFAYPPDDPSLERFRDENYEPINHKHLETIYPPFAQAVFALGAWIRPTLSTQKTLFVIFDLATILLLVPLLRLRRLSVSAVVVYAWNPLVIFETAHSGHLDPVGVFFLVLGVYLLLRGNMPTGFASLAVSFLTKYLTISLAPFFLARRKMAPWVAVAAAVAIAGYLPFAGAGRGLVSSLAVYGTEWSFNGSLYGVLFALWRNAEGVRWVLSAGVVVVALYQAFKQGDLVRYTFIIIGTGLLLAPTLYPWYLVWIVPFLCLRPNRAWIAFTGLVFLSYWVWEVSVTEGRWSLPMPLYFVEYVPFYGLLLYDTLRGRRRVGGDA